MSKNLYTDDHPETTLYGLEFRNKELAKKSIKKIEKYFEDMKRKQKKNTFSPSNVRPKKFLKTVKEIKFYYQLQKKYRVLGLHNRILGMLKKKKNKKDLLEALIIFKDWLNKNK